jgi:hypothetical protein
MPQSNARIILMFSTTEGFNSKFLQWAQRSPYSHIEAVFPTYNLGSRASHGVQRYTDYYKTREFAYIECSTEEKRLFDQYIHSKLEQDYDWRAFVGFFLYSRTQVNHKWFCSELIQKALEHAGVNIIERQPAGWTMPRDFLISPLVVKAEGLEEELIAEGYFKNYKVQ